MNTKIPPKDRIEDGREADRENEAPDALGRAGKKTAVEREDDDDQDASALEAFDEEGAGIAAKE
ncbi:hypothetical protein [Sphingosinicella rhizophila]|uniref:Uncharacterized protein n=1 Tax=Sphingosinicella rhizophila TaxID=3050082 RepID=A0ABU3Q887_9SPHN|nr:hypothetical protein [Sphingosinicella sp. GR2756]MDT9599616.1 hypothetical protein [Sphingosinicella sp. GR2756]